MKLTMTQFTDEELVSIRLHTPYLALVSALEHKYDLDLAEHMEAFISRMSHQLKELTDSSVSEQEVMLAETWEEIFPKINAMLDSPIEDQAEVFLDPGIVFNSENIGDELPSPEECSEILEKHLDDWGNALEETVVPPKTDIEEKDKADAECTDTCCEHEEAEVVLKTDEVVVEKPVEKELDIATINGLADSLNLTATATGVGVINWPWFLEIQKLMQAQSDMTNFASVLGQLKESGHIKSRRDLLDSILMAFSGEIGFDAVVAISALFEDLE